MPDFKRLGKNVKIYEKAKLIKPVVSVECKSQWAPRDWRMVYDTISGRITKTLIRSKRRQRKTIKFRFKSTR